jgi:two-component system cell cycle sensor histidine kinase/response regulator CckA
MVKKHTVLLVEDDESYRYALGKALEGAGCEVVEVGDYSAALGILESDRTIDLMVTDVVLPQVHGFFLARLAVVRRPHLSIMYMSAFDNLPRHEMDFGFGRFLRKPDDMSELVAAVKAELERLPK